MSCCSYQLTNSDILRPSARRKYTHITQYTAYLTSAISRGSTVWRHAIMNACQGHILPHPLHNPITIFRQWYTNLPISPQLLQNPSPYIITKSAPLQTDGWSCGLHMLPINIVTIYQGTLPTLRHTQTHAHHLSRIHLR